MRQQKLSLCVMDHESGVIFARVPTILIRAAAFAAIDAEEFRLQRIDASLVCTKVFRSHDDVVNDQRDFLPSLARPLSKFDFQGQFRFSSVCKVLF
jgi:hypothetical protein